MVNIISTCGCQNKAIIFKTSTELRNWFSTEHDKSKEVWIGFYKKDSRKISVTYPEAVDQALCFGWIDGIRRKVQMILGIPIDSHRAGQRAMWWIIPADGLYRFTATSTAFKQNLCDRSLDTAQPTIFRVYTSIIALK